MTPDAMVYMPGSATGIACSQSI